jgi:hypothetical protein
LPFGDTATAQIVTIATNIFKKKDRLVIINKQYVPLAIACLLAFGCGDPGNVKLSVDFSKRAEWRYAMAATISGSIASADTQLSFASAAQCSLSGKPDLKNSSVLHASVAAVSISSNILGNAEMQNLKDQAKTVRLACALADGTIMPEDSSSIPVVRIGEWDLYKDLAKTIPSLPKIAIRPGFVWERQADLPLDTKQGNAVGHLFQSFSLDSVRGKSSDAQTAFLSWRFTYRVEFKDHTAAGMYASVPTAGTGRGQAIVDVTNKMLLSASVHFDVPATTQGMFRISWKEDITLDLMK